MERKRVAKRLVLNRETVRVLDESELRQAAGAIHTVSFCCTPVVWTIPVGQCLSRDVYPCP